MVQGARTGGLEDQPMVASVYLVHAGRVLLVLHSGFWRWVPPGGHMERGETPSEAARREASEETGLDIELVSASPVIHAKDDNATSSLRDSPVLWLCSTIGGGWRAKTRNFAIRSPRWTELPGLHWTNWRHCRRSTRFGPSPHSLSETTPTYQRSRPA